MMRTRGVHEIRTIQRYVAVQGEHATLSFVPSVLAQFDVDLVNSSPPARQVAAE
jgi:hypothetical protein